MEQLTWLTVLQGLATPIQALAALVVAVFTWKLAQYTQKLVEAQEASNRVLERQEKIQKILARAEVEPLVSLHLSLGAPARLFLSNLGKYGVEVEGVWAHHSEEVERPLSDVGEPMKLRSEGVGGLPAPTSGAPLFPLSIGPGASLYLTLDNPTSIFAQQAGFIEIRYRHGVDPGVLLSDLWAVERREEQPATPRRLRRVWRAREVPEARDQES